MTRHSDTDTSPRYEQPLIIKPETLPHKQTIILLHGRDSNSTMFGPGILFMDLPFHRLKPSIHRAAARSSSKNLHETINLRSAFPHAKFIFPTAPEQVAKAFKDLEMTQWFDNYPLVATAAAAAAKDLDDETQNRWRYELPIPGLRQTVRFIHELVKNEIELLNGDAAGVVLGGFSQGSAASLVSAMVWEGESLGAWVGMSGWLPFADEITEAAMDDDEGADDNDDNDDDDDDDDDNNNNKQMSAVQKGVCKLRNILDLSSSVEPCTKDVPIENTSLFMAHGVQDDTVPIFLGRRVATCLEALRLDVQQKEYQNGRHECTEEMLCDLVEFLWDKIGR